MWQLVCPLNSMEIRGTIISWGDRILLEVWLYSERGGESINTLINFRKYTGVINTSMSASSAWTDYSGKNSITFQVDDIYKNYWNKQGMKKKETHENHLECIALLLIKTACDLQCMYRMVHAYTIWWVHFVLPNTQWPKLANSKACWFILCVYMQF